MMGLLDTRDNSDDPIWFGTLMTIPVWPGSKDNFYFILLCIRIPPFSVKCHEKNICAKIRIKWSGTISGH